MSKPFLCFSDGVNRQICLPLSDTKWWQNTWSISVLQTFIPWVSEHWWSTGHILVKLIVLYAVWCVFYYIFHICSVLFIEPKLNYDVPFKWNGNSKQWMVKAFAKKNIQSYKDLYDNVWYIPFLVFFDMYFCWCHYNIMVINAGWSSPLWNLSRAPADTRITTG